MKVLVTGGAGFIGSNFVTRSLERQNNLELIVLDSLTYAGDLKNLGEVLQNIQFEKGDVRDDLLVDRLVLESDIVIHFAAESHNDNSLENPGIFYETNILGTQNIVRACLRYQVKMHHVSTDEVFGDLPLDSVEEFDVDSPYKPSSPYSASKASSDHIVRASIRSFDLNATISNCSNNYGPRQNWEKLIPRSIRLILEGRKPQLYGNGLNVRDWIHVDDHTDGIWRILNHGMPGSTYLLGSRNRVSNLELVRGILASMEKPLDFIDFIDDRAGHDRKYAINPSSSNGIGWHPNYRSILSNLPDLVSYYSGKFAEECHNT